MLTHKTRHQIAPRRLPVGAEVVSPNGASVHFRVWAPDHQRIEAAIENKSPIELSAEAGGYFSGLSTEARAGDLYRYRIDGGEAFPDPVSRFQPQGVHGPSQIIDHNFLWSDQHFPGITAHGQVLYEFHVGTFTKEGTWSAAERQLPYLKDLGITCLEIMPVNEFPGRWGWGYDGVYLFAPFHHYGSPDDFRSFINAAHKLGIGAILDVVYNHFGPDGNYIAKFSPHYFNPHHHTDWGDAINFDGEHCSPVREFYLANALYWITEFHLDGFRFDATQAIVDTSPEHILAEINRRVRQDAPHKSLYLINEYEPQDTKLVRQREQGGYGLDALWNDDFHHSAIVALTGRAEAYYTDYRGTAQEFISAAKWGYLFQGQRYKWQKKRRGTPALDLPPTAFIHFIQNHDQIANSGTGFRIHHVTSPGEFKAITALLLLMPQTPMLFQGQEFAATSAFHYFADHNPELAKLIAAGRAKELSQFPSLATTEMQSSLPDPGAEKTFLNSKIDLFEREKPPHAQIVQLHKDLLDLRRGQKRGDIDGAVLSLRALVLRYFAAEGSEHDRLLIVNLDADEHLDPAPEPLLAPPAGYRWSILLSTEDPKYGGSGTPALDTEQEGWRIPGRCAVVLHPHPDEAQKRMNPPPSPGTPGEGGGEGRHAKSKG